MTAIELVLLLLAVSVALRVLAERLRIPYATLLVLGGLALAAVPSAADADQESRDSDVAGYLREQHRTRVRRWSADQRAERRAAKYRRLRTEMIDAERRALFRLRDREEIGDDVMRRVQRELDLEQLLLETSEPVVEVPRAVRPPEE